jgi:hypothetical protein
MEEETFCLRYDEENIMLRHKGKRPPFPDYQTWEWREKLSRSGPERQQGKSWLSKLANQASSYLMRLVGGKTDKNHLPGELTAGTRLEQNSLSNDRHESG